MKFPIVPLMSKKLALSPPEIIVSTVVEDTVTPSILKSPVIFPKI